MVGEREGETVGALELDVLACEDEVGRLGRDSRGHSGGLGVDLDVDGVGDIIDGGGVGGREGSLGPNQRRHDALQQNVGVDQRDAAERGVGGRLPAVVPDDEHLERDVGDGELKEGAGPFLARAVGVLEQRGDRNVDGLGARVDEGDHLLPRDLDFDLVVDVGLVMGEDVEHRLVGDEVAGDMRQGRKGATDTKEDPGRPRGVVTRICTGRGPP